MSNLKISAFADEASSSVKEQIQALNENGVEFIEPRGLDGTNVSDLTLDRAKEYAKMFADGGIKVYSVGSPIGKIGIDDDFDKEMEKFKRTVEIGNIMDAKCIRMFSFYNTDAKPEMFPRVVERLQKYVEASKGSGITLCHENERGIYGELAPQCLEIVKAVPEIKNIFDPANYILAGQDIAEAWKLLREHTIYFHVKDALPEGKIVPAGMGIGMFKELLTDFSKDGGGILTVEPHLTEFVGLDNLVRGDETEHMGKIAFASNREAFDFAVTSLKNIIKEI